MADEQIILITGASRGIGRAIALRLAESGSVLLLNHFDREPDAADQTLKDVLDRGARGKIYHYNVADFRETQVQLEGMLAEWGRIDVLINNAGITRDTLLMRMKEEDWDLVLDINLKGVYNATQAVIRSMIKNKAGKIVNYRLGGRGHRQCRAIQLRGFQGGDHRFQQIGGQGSGRAGHYGQRRGSRFYRHGDDRRPPGAGPPGIFEVDPHGPQRATRGGSRPGGLSDFRGGGIYHRPGASYQRGDVYVRGSAEPHKSETRNSKSETNPNDRISKSETFLY